MLAVRLMFLLIASVGYLYLSGLWAAAVYSQHSTVTILNILRFLLPAVGGTLAAGMGERWTGSTQGSLLFWGFTVAWLLIVFLPIFGIPIPGLRMSAIPGIACLLGWFAGLSPTAQQNRFDWGQIVALIATAIAALIVHNFLMGDWQMYIVGGVGGAFIRLLGAVMALFAAGALFEILVPGGDIGDGRRVGFAALLLWLVPLVTVAYDLATLDLAGTVYGMEPWPDTWRAFYAPIMLAIISGPVGTMTVRGFKVRSRPEDDGPSPR